MSEDKASAPTSADLTRLVDEIEDKEERETVKEFISQAGGIDAILREMGEAA